MLYILPNFLSEDELLQNALPACLPSVIENLQGLFVETPKCARAYLKRLGLKDIRRFSMFEINEHTTKEEMKELFKLLEKGDWGLVSDAGMPMLADPGSQLVAFANKKGIKVQVISGPSSITCALMLSGFPGQTFRFNGYFPKKAGEKFYQNLAKRLKKEQTPEIFIEVPYRNNPRMKELITNLPGHIQLCVAVDLMASAQEVKTHFIKDWKICSFDYHKRPAVFVLYD